MKHIKILVLPILIILLTVSCNMNLDRLPETNLSDQAFWNTEDNFKAACNQLYTFVSGPAIVYDDCRSDFASPLALNNISDGSRVTPSTSSDWDTPYKLIFTANKIIEKSDNADFPSKDRWIAEARFWRAYAYFDLVKKFGNVPLVLKVLDIDSPEFTDGRTDREIIVKQIYDDLDFSAANLPTFLQLGQAEYGRISKSAALALKSRAGLYIGTHQKYHSWGDPSTNLSLAITAAEAVMAEGHSLYTEKPYYYLFQNDGEGFPNKENILAIIYGQNLGNSIKSHNIGRELENGRSNITRAMIEQYLCTDGLPFDKSPLAEWPETSPGSVFKSKDPRMDASLFTEGEPYGNPATYEWDKGYANTRFSPQKYSIVADWGTAQSFVDIAMIRYAEVLLNYVEAKFEKDGTISDADLDKSINLLRDRVSMPHLTNAFVSAHDLDMKTEIRRERSVELSQEGFRYDDIIRWKTAEIVLPQRMIGATFFASVYTGIANVTSDNYILVQSAGARHFDPQKDYLYPIPVREIALSGETITQNPNW